MRSNGSRLEAHWRRGRTPGCEKGWVPEVASGHHARPGTRHPPNAEARSSVEVTEWGAEPGAEPPRALSGDLQTTEEQLQGGHAQGRSSPGAATRLSKRLFHSRKEPSRRPGDEVSTGCIRRGHGAKPASVSNSALGNACRKRRRDARQIVQLKCAVFLRRSSKLLLTCTLSVFPRPTCRMPDDANRRPRPNDFACFHIKMCRAPCRRRWRSTRCMMRVSASAVFAALFAFSAFDPLESYPAALRGYTWTYFGDPVSPDSLEACFSHVSGDATLNGTARGDAAAVVALTTLLDLAGREGLPLRTTASLALSSALEGGAYHVVLVPGGSPALWTDDALEAVGEAIAGVVDHHGDALPTRFSRVSPSAVRVRAPLALRSQPGGLYVMLCFSRSAWESATSGPALSGASRRAPRPSCTSRQYLCRRACRCDSGRPRPASSRRCGRLRPGATHSPPP